MVRETFRRDVVRSVVRFCIVLLPLLSDPTGRVQARRSARGEPWFYETRPRRVGLTLFRVLRKGLELVSCFGRTSAEQNGTNETASRTHVPDPGAVGETNVRPRGLRDRELSVHRPTPAPKVLDELLRLRGYHGPGNHAIILSRCLMHIEADILGSPLHEGRSWLRVVT
jgi:hypothetical protein